MKTRRQDIYKRPEEDYQIFNAAVAAVAELSKGKLAESTSSRHQHIYLSFFQFSITIDSKDFFRRSGETKQLAV